MIIQMPGTKVSPETVLARTLEEKPKVVLVVYLREDDIWDCDSSTASLRDMLYGCEQLRQEVLHCCFGAD